jgi:hypothetical protein
MNNYLLRNNFIMTKKIVRLTESDLERIVRRVIKESMGVGFMSGEPNGLKIKKMETKEQLRTGEVTPDQTKPLFDKGMLVVNQKLPLDSKTLTTMASKLNGIEKSLVGPQFETALAGVWGQDLADKFNNSISTLGYQLGQSGPYKNLMGGRAIPNINSIAAVSAMVNDLKLLRDGLTYLAQVKAGMKVTPSDVIKQALPFLKDFSQKNQLGLA